MLHCRTTHPMAWIQTVSSPALFRTVRKHWSNFGYSNAGPPRVFRPGLRAETSAAARLRRDTLEHAQPGQITSKSVGAKARSRADGAHAYKQRGERNQISAAWYAARAGLKRPPRNGRSSGTVYLASGQLSTRKHPARAKRPIERSRGLKRTSKPYQSPVAL